MADLPKNRTLVYLAVVLGVLVILGYATWDQLAALLTGLAGLL